MAQPLDLLLLDYGEDAATLVMGMATPVPGLETMVGQSTWASPGGRLRSAVSWEEAGHCFRGCVGLLDGWMAAQCGPTVGAGSSPPTIGNLFIALMTVVDPPGNRPANERRQWLAGTQGKLVGPAPL